jgi:uncharacterized RDD family membrane protein YckC
MVLAQAKGNLKLIYNEIFGEETDHPLVARFLALILDYTIFVASGLIIYFGLGAIDKQSAPNQLIVSMVLCTTYFTLGNSKVFQGQTLGKKLLRIRVVDNESSYLGLGKSLIRSIPIVLLMHGYQIMYCIYVTEQHNLYIFALYGLTTILFGSIYFPLLKTNRQTLHDLTVYSQVIPKSRTIKIHKKFNWTLIAGFVLIMVTFVTFMLKRS